MPPPVPRRNPGEGGFTPTPADKPRPGFTPAPPPILLRPGRPPVANTPVILDSRKTEPSYSGETELSRILGPGGKPVGWVEKGADISIRTVTFGEFAKLKEALLKDATELPQTDHGASKAYKGKRYQLPDKEIFGIRVSKNHGETIDVFSTKTTLIKKDFKVHWKE